MTSGDGCDNNCTPTECGNGVVTAGEACDDGNTTNGDACDNNCTVPGCGNGIKVGPRGSATTATSTTATAATSTARSTRCGNGIVDRQRGLRRRQLHERRWLRQQLHGDGVRQRDRDRHRELRRRQHDQRRRLRQQLQAHRLPERRRDDRRGVRRRQRWSTAMPATATAPSPACGNGIEAGTEQCDDGNMTNGDGCDSNCTPTGVPQRHRDDRRGVRRRQHGQHRRLHERLPDRGVRRRHHAHHARTAEQCDDGNTTTSPAPTA